MIPSDGSVSGGVLMPGRITHGNGQIIDLVNVDSDLVDGTCEAAG